MDVHCGSGVAQRTGTPPQNVLCRRVNTSISYDTLLHLQTHLGCLRCSELTASSVTMRREFITLAAWHGMHVTATIPERYTVCLQAL